MLRLIKFIWILCWSFSIFAWLSQWVNFCFCFLFLIFCFKDNIWDRCHFLTALLFLLLNFLFFIFNLILLVFNIWLFSIVLFITTYKVTKNIFDFICYFLCLWLLLLNFIIDFFIFLIFFNFIICIYNLTISFNAIFYIDNIFNRQFIFLLNFITSLLLNFTLNLDILFYFTLISYLFISFNFTILYWSTNLTLSISFSHLFYFL